MGHIISAVGVATDPNKIDAVSQWPRPSNVAELRSFLGFASYYRRFVEGFEKLAAPLHKLVGEFAAVKGRKVGSSFGGAWDVRCQESFEGLKEKLTSTPVLHMQIFLNLLSWRWTLAIKIWGQSFPRNREERTYCYWMLLARIISRSSLVVPRVRSMSGDQG